MLSARVRGAVLDLGSNTFKLLLAEQRNGVLHIFHEKAYPVRLGEGVAVTGKLQPAAVRRALRMLFFLSKKISSFAPDQVVAVGTGALRRARNRPAFLQPASKILRQPVRMLSGQEEGRLIALAARSLSRPPRPRYHIDLGGGSLEVIDSRNPKKPKIQSLDIGCVAVRDTLLSRQPPSPDEWMRARGKIEKVLRKLPRPNRSTQATFTGGTGHAYACLLRQKNVKARRLENLPIRREELIRLILRLLPLSAREMGRLPGMPADRVTVALPAFLVLDEAIQRLRLSKIRVSTHGLRYGVWLGHLAPAPIRRISR
jgi:exopolyphosphatase/guanosine-5'-triphosphate,3'-diphosphate pyrophosphatase